MSLNRYARKRDISEPEIVAEFERAGADVEKLSAKGVPDLLVGYRGRTRLVEVKTGNEILSAGQVIWHENWAGERPEVCRNAAQARKLVRLWDEQASLELRQHNALQASAPDAETPDHGENAGKDLSAGAA